MSKTERRPLLSVKRKPAYTNDPPPKNNSVGSTATLKDIPDEVLQKIFSFALRGKPPELVDGTEDPGEKSPGPTELEPSPTIDRETDSLASHGRIVSSAGTAAELVSATPKNRKRGKMKALALELAPVFATLSSLRATSRSFRLLVDDLCNQNPIILNALVAELHFKTVRLSLEEEEWFRKTLDAAGAHAGNAIYDKTFDRYVMSKESQTLAYLIQRAAQTIDNQRCSDSLSSRVKRSCVQHPKALASAYTPLVFFLTLTVALGATGKLNNNPFGQGSLTVGIALSLTCIVLTHMLITRQRGECTPRRGAGRVNSLSSYFFRDEPYPLISETDYAAEIGRRALN